MFPVMLVATFFFVLAFVPGGDPRPRPAWLDALWNRRRAWWAKGLVGINAARARVCMSVCEGTELEFPAFSLQPFPEWLHDVRPGKRHAKPLRKRWRDDVLLSAAEFHRPSLEGRQGTGIGRRIEQRQFPRGPRSSVAMVLPGDSTLRYAIGLHDISALGRKVQLVQLAVEFEAVRPVFDRRANGGDGPSAID